MATHNQDGIQIPDVPIITAPTPVSPNATPDTAGNDLTAITVSAPPLLMASLSDWLKPPKVYLLAAGAAIAYYLFSRRER